MTRVREIARKMSLSPATVSKTLSGRYGSGAVSISTATRILDFCFHNGYLSSADRDRILLKMKIQANDKKLFCISSYEGMWGYNALFSCINRQLQHNGQYTSFFSVKAKTDLIRFPYSETSAVIVFGRIMPEVYAGLHDHGVPVVLLDNFIPEFRCHTVNSANLTSTGKSVEILAGLGHRRIAFMCRHEDASGLPTYNLHQRQSGYLVGMANMGLDAQGLIYTMNALPNDETSSSSAEADLRCLADKILSANPRPTAVVAANDLTAHILRSEALKRGLSVPHDISVIGYDGQHLLPGIIGFEAVSTMVVNWDEMAVAAVDLAHELIVNPQKQARSIEIPTEYMDMGTVAGPQTEKGGV